MKAQVHWNSEDGFEISAPAPQRAAEAVLTALRPEPAAMTVALVGEPTMARLHLEHMREPGPTDVLSYADGDPDPESGLPYLGDVVICVPVAEQQARAGGHPLAAELELLAVHGTLHLLGYDHDTPATRRAMWRLQAQVLEQIGSQAKPLEVE